MCDLFQDLALPIAGHYGLTYPHLGAKRVRAHLLRVQALPCDAREVY